MTKIEKIETYPVNVPLREPFVMSSGATSSVESLIIRIVTDDETEGIGEARVGYNTGFTHESIESMKLVMDRYFGPALIGEPVMSINNLMEKVHKAWQAGYTITKSGVEMALYDVIAKRYDTSVSEVLGGAYHKKIGLVGSVSCDEPIKMANQAAFWVERGHKVLKAKIGRGVDVGLDVRRVSEVRAAIGNDVDLRLDCNSAYRVDTALRLISQLQRYDPCFLEDPVETWNFEGLVRLTRVSDVPICVDNILFSPQDAYNVLSRGAGHIIKIKLQRVGGFNNALKMIAVAESAGIPVVVGRGSTLSIAAAAEHHLIAVSKNVIPWGENTASQKQDEDVVKVPMQISGGYASCPRETGLGVELDPEKVRKYLTD